MKVSVLTPTFEYGRFLPTALASVEGQSYLDCEHVVVDGGSSDDTVEVLERSATRWISEPDAGQSDALNKALRLATGEWIAWLNADEFYLPWTLQTLVDHSEGADVVFGDFILADRGGYPERLVALRELNRFCLQNYGTMIPTCAVLIRRSVLGSDPWDVDLRRIMDWDLWLNLMGQGARFRYVPQPLGVFMRHGANVTASPTPEGDPERATVSSRHGLAHGGIRWDLRHAAGRGEHFLRKALTGAHRRQRRFDRAIGPESLLWQPGADVDDLHLRFERAGGITR